MYLLGSIFCLIFPQVLNEYHQTRVCLTSWCHQEYMLSQYVFTCGLVENPRCDTNAPKSIESHIAAENLRFTQQTYIQYTLELSTWHHQTWIDLDSSKFYSAVESSALERVYLKYLRKSSTWYHRHSTRVDSTSPMREVKSMQYISKIVVDLRVLPSDSDLIRASVAAERQRSSAVSLSGPRKISRPVKSELRSISCHKH
jgi:hypothetical protein